MADTTQTVEVQLKAVDLATGVIKNIGKATGSLLKSVDKISGKFGSLLGKYGGLGTVLSLGSSVYSAKKYFEEIKRIKSLAGGTANEIAGIRYAMVKAGASAEIMEQSYVNLAMKGAEMRKEAKHWGGETTRFANRIGVDFRKGPLESLVQMSAQMKKGKIGYAELVKLGGNSALKLRKFLKMGPEVVRAQIEEAKKKMGAVNDQTIAAYSKFKKETGRIKQAWNRVVVTIGARLLPIMNRLISGLSDRLDGWADKAAHFGEILATHMNLVVGLAKTFGKIMMANYVLMKATGKGLHGHMSGLVERARGSAGSGIVSRGGRKVMGGARGMMAGGLMRMMARGGIIGKLGGGLSRLGAVFGKFFQGAMRLAPIAGQLLRLAAVAGVVIAIVKGVQMALKYVDGLQKSISKLLQNIGREINAIGATISAIFSRESPLGKALIWIGNIAASFFGGILLMVKKVLEFVNQIIGMIGAMINDPTLITSPGKAWAKGAEYSMTARAKAAGGAGQFIESMASAGRLTKLTKWSDAQLAAAKHTVKSLDKWNEYFELKPTTAKNLASLKKRINDMEAPGERPEIYQDFRGSRFDITQKFAEGFDPDRIATAFANDLSNFGERKVMANMGPAFSVR